MVFKLDFFKKGILRYYRYVIIFNDNREINQIYLVKISNWGECLIKQRD